METKPLARVLGLALVLLVLGMMVNRQASLDALTTFFASPGLMWITGIFTMILGLVVVTTHNRWSGGLLPILVTLYGWAAVIKGALFVILPTTMQLQWYQALHFPEWYYVYLSVSLVLGGYLAYGGYKQP